MSSASYILKILVFVFIFICVSKNSQQVNTQQTNLSFQILDQQLQTLNPSFFQNFRAYYTPQFIQQLYYQQQQAQYLHLLGKIYLYNLQNQIFTQSQKLQQGRYLLAYFYFKVAAQIMSFPQSYYYLSVMQFFRLIPDSIIAFNFQQKFENHEMKDFSFNQIIKTLKYTHLTSVEFSLYQSSLLDLQSGVPQTILANFNKQGIGMEKNCSAAASYYLSIISKNFIDTYQFMPIQPYTDNFEKQLYAKRKIQFLNFGNQDIQSIQGSSFFDNQMIRNNLQIAFNYFYGINGYLRNYQKAAKIFQMLSDQGHSEAINMLGLCYLKGLGVKKNLQKARQLFTKIQKKVQVADFMITAMDFFGLDGKINKQKAIKKLLDKQKKQNQRIGKMSNLEKYLLGSLIAKGQVQGRNKDDGVVLLQEASLTGSKMASIIMGIQFLDGSDTSYDCWKSINYFSQQVTQRVFFRDKYQIAKMAIKKQLYSFSLIKYMQLMMAGIEYSFINGLYLLQLYGKQSLQLNNHSWSIKSAMNHESYKLVKKLGFVPSLDSYLVKQYQFQPSVNPYSSNKSIKRKFITISNINDYLITQDNKQTFDIYFSYVRHKTITIGAMTKQNILLKFFQFKDSLHQEMKAIKAKNNIKQDQQQFQQHSLTDRKYQISTEISTSTLQLLRTVANGQMQKLHVLQARYLLGKYYQKKDHQTFLKKKNQIEQEQKQIQNKKQISDQQRQKLEKNTKIKKAQLIDPSTNAMMNYKLATKSQILAALIYFLQGGQIQFGIMDDLMTYVFFILVIMLILYIHRNRRLNQIFQQELNKNLIQEQDKKQQQRQQQTIIRNQQRSQNNLSEQKHFHSQNRE